MMRLRLLDQVMPKIKRIDPNTALTRNAARQLGRVAVLSLGFATGTAANSGDRGHTGTVGEVIP